MRPHTAKKQFRHLRVLDLKFDHSPSNMQWGDKQTIQGHFGPYLK